MKANTSPGSSASFVPVVLSHEFNPAISIDFHSFNLETPITAPQSTFFAEISPNIRKETVGSLPLPPVACSIFRWSTVICSISAFSNLADPFEIRDSYKQRLTSTRNFHLIYFPLSSALWFQFPLSLDILGLILS